MLSGASSIGDDEDVDRCYAKSGSWSDFRTGPFWYDYVKVCFFHMEFEWHNLVFHPRARGSRLVYQQEISLLDVGTDCGASTQLKLCIGQVLYG